MNVIAKAAQLACVDIYDEITPGIFNKIYRVGETTCGTVFDGDTVYIDFQGTENRAGWLADADILPFNHPELGPLHTGFYQNLPELLRQLSLDINKRIKIIITGHSKGAGEGSIAGPMLKLMGFNIIQLILFACPNSGHKQLADWVARNIRGSLSFRNAPRYFPILGDPVPCVPLDPFYPPVPHTAVCKSPSGFLFLVSAEWHMGGLYRDAIKTLYPN
jgi:hypothetical protein